jgi:ribonuclease HI
MLGFLKVILESDSKLVVQLIMQVSITVEANYSLIAKPKELLDREWKIKVQYVYREANQATDWLAKFILSMNSLDRSN